MELQCRLKAAAKINIGLRVGQPLPDGYHPILSIMHPISLFDSLQILVEKGNSDIIVEGAFDCPAQSTTVYRAARLFIDASGFPYGLKIKVQKQIPPRGGLGGGSSDAAAVLVGLDKILDHAVGEEELFHIGMAIGADVPFFMKSEAAIVAGKGELVRAIEARSDFGILLVFPGFGVSTRWAYESLDRFRLEKQGLSAGVCVSGADPWEGAQGMLSMFKSSPAQWSFENSFSPMLFEACPVYELLQKLLLADGAEYVSITGSGSCIYGIYQSQDDAESARKRVLSAIHSSMPEKTMQSMELFAKRPLERTIYLE